MVLPGTEIFNIFFDGTSNEDLDDRGNVVLRNLQSDWGRLDAFFANALADAADASNDKVKTMLEQWYEVLKKVMRLWMSRSVVSKNQMSKAGYGSKSS